MLSVLFLLLIFGKTIVFVNAAVIPTAQGLVSGFDTDGFSTFLGIPFATPPTGSLRWTPPQPHAPWSGTWNATQMPPACSQPVGSLFNLTNQSEDCLYLNVYVPGGSPPKGGFPVMVWFFGGGFIYGAASQYDGTFLANYTDVIVVVGNYRVGPFGFLAHPALSQESALQTSGNYGLMDQQMVLMWVRQNIAAFGGDTNSVTIFGESAGGVSVCMHLLSPLSKGLYQKAILQSGPCLNTPSLDWAYSLGAKFQSAANCSSSNASDIVACMRDLSVAEVLNCIPVPDCSTPPAVIWWPIRDGVVMPTADTLTLLQENSFYNVPVLQGSNLNEGTIFIYPCYNGTISENEYENIVEIGYDLWSEDLLQIYPYGNYLTGEAALSDLVGDGFFTCQVVNFAQALAAAGGTLYSYIYTHTPSFIPQYWGALHGGEILLEFYNVQQVPITQGEHELAYFLMNAWTSFAKTGNPNYDPYIESWNPFESSGKRLVIDVEVSSSSIYKQQECQFWAQTYSNVTWNFM